MSKLDDKHLNEIAAGGGQSIVPEGPSGGDAPDHGNVEDNTPTPGGSIGPDEEGEGGGPGAAGQG